MGLSAGVEVGSEMGSTKAGAFAGMIWNQTFNVLATATNESTATPPDGTGSAYEITAKFNPSMAIIIIVLISAFLFMGFFSIYVRRCTTTEPDNNNAQTRPAGGDNQNRSGQGLDRAVVETLPLVGYSLVKGLKGGKDLSECAVCLSEFEEDETLRLLPKCGHLFHPECIDMWFFSHSTCPLCRCSLVPAGEAKEGAGAGAGAPAQGFANWVRVDSRGNVSEGLAITIHDGPPAPPNGSILELLSRENAERLLTESLSASLRRESERVDAGLASRERDVGEGKAGDLRALNRALSRNSTSFRKAARGIEVVERIGAASESARFHPSTIAGAGLGGNGGATGAAYFDKRGNNRSVGSSQSFNMTALRRSSSVGSSGRYIRQLFGQNYADYFSPETAGDGLRVDRARLLGEHRMPAKESSKVRRQKSEDELHNMFFNELQNMTYTDDSRRGSSTYRSGELWDSIDLQNESIRAAQQAAAQEQILLSSQNRTRSEELPPWQRNLDFPSSGKSGELPPLSRNGDKRVRLQGEASGPLYMRRKGNGSTGGDGGARSDRWNFNIRRTFSLRRTFSDSRDQLDSLGSSNNDSARWYLPGSGIPTPPSTKPKKYSSPWAAAMKDRRSQSVDQTASGASTPTASHPSPSSVFSPYALSLPSPIVNQAYSLQSSALPSPAGVSSSTPSNLSSPTVPQSSGSSQGQSSSQQQQQQQQAGSESQIQIITQ